jgi:hypothetical protein
MIKLIDAETIIDMVVDYYGVDHELLFSELRYRDLVMPRHICRFLIHKNTSLPLRQIAAEMKGRKYKKNDHSTIISSCRLVKNLMDVDPQIRLQVAELQNFIDTHKEKEYQKVEHIIKTRREKFLKDQAKRQREFLEGYVEKPTAKMVRMETLAESEKVLNSYL